MLASLQRFSFALWALALTLAIPFLYQLVIEATRPSPLSPLSGEALLETMLTGGQLALAVAALLALFALCLSLFLSFLRSETGRILHYVVLGLCIVLLAIGLLPAIENFLYTVVGSSLKTSEDMGSKILVAGVALFLALAFARPLVALAGVLSRSNILNAAMLLAAVAALAVTMPDINSQAMSSLHAGNSPRYNVLIVSSDGIDADRMSVYGYQRPTTPFLDKVASEFLLYKNAFTNNANTTGSITALFTGRSPITTHVVYPPDILVGEDTIMHMPGILGAYGYYRSNWAVPHFADASSQNMMDAFESNVGVSGGMDISSWLPIKSAGVGGWLARRTVSDIQTLALDVLNIQEAANPFDQITGGENTLSDQQRLEGVLADIQSEKPFFTHVHFMDTHGPLFSPANPLFSAGMKQRTDFQPEFLDDVVRDFDGRVAQIYAALEQAGKLDNTILVVTTDHPMLYNSILRIPLLIRLPGMSATGEVAENVQRLDLAPTILSLLKIPVPAWMEGQNLLQDIPPDRMIVTTKARAPRFGEEGQWVHPGSRPFGPHHLITVLYCDRYFVFELPLKLSRSGKIKGTTSPCAAGNDSTVVDALGQRLLRLL